MCIFYLSSSLKLCALLLPCLLFVSCTSSYPQDPKALYTPPIIDEMPDPSPEDLAEAHKKSEKDRRASADSLSKKQPKV